MRFFFPHVTQKYLAFHDKKQGQMDIILFIIANVYENFLRLGTVHILNGTLYYIHGLILSL